jgi:hypothetical protein
VPFKFNLYRYSTGNNFARDLGIRTIPDMFAIIDKRTTHAVDAVKVTHPEGVTYSINCITWGEGRGGVKVRFTPRAVRILVIFTRLFYDHVFLGNFYFNFYPIFSIRRRRDYNLGFSFCLC